MEHERLGDEVMRQGRALGDPTRFAVFRYLDESATPVGVAELAAHFGVHHNAIRQHLAKLKAAGLVVEEVGAAVRPGRPPLRYRPALDVSVRWGGASPYEDLALLLLEVLGGRPAREVGVAAGERLAARARRGVVDTVALLEAVTRRQGFEPTRATTADGVELVLGRCPLAEAASVAPELICELHRGIAEGVARAGGRLEVTGLVVRPPRRAGCRLQLAGTGA